MSQGRPSPHWPGSTLISMDTSPSALAPLAAYLWRTPSPVQGCLARIHASPGTPSAQTSSQAARRLFSVVILVQIGGRGHAAVAFLESAWYRCALPAQCFLTSSTHRSYQNHLPPSSHPYPLARFLPSTARQNSVCRCKVNPG